MLALVDWGIKGMRSAAWSTGEAELAALCEALRRSGVSIWMLVQGLTASPKSPLWAYGDAHACLGAVRRGASPAMRYIANTQGVCIAWLRGLLTLVENVELKDT